MEVGWQRSAGMRMLGAVVDVRRLQVGAHTVSRFGVQSKLPTMTMVLSFLKTETILHR